MQGISYMMKEKERMRMDKLYAAPMEGLTTYVWRRAQRDIFGGVDKYFTPFLSPNGNLAFQQKELDEVSQGETDTVPQLLTNQGAHFLWAARVLRDMGYGEINFNLGCPSGTVAAKHKGAGLLAYPQELTQCLDEIYGGLPELRVSLKTRIGRSSAAEWPALLAIYGRYPAAELIVHPRVQKQFYKGTVDRGAFELALEQWQGPLVYNGDLFTAADVELTAFHDRLVEDYRQRLSGDTPVLHRMRELWSYLGGSFDGGERERKAIRKARTLAEYDAAAQRLLRDCPLREAAVVER